MEALQQEGKVKSIGVSNFRISDMKELLRAAKVCQLLRARLPWKSLPSPAQAYR
jgi:predicted oxidoreductase